MIDLDEFFDEVEQRQDRRLELVAEIEEIDQWFALLAERSKVLWQKFKPTGKQIADAIAWATGESDENKREEPVEEAPPPPESKNVDQSASGTPASKGRRYTPEEKAEALEKCGRRAQVVVLSDGTQIPAITIKKWIEADKAQPLPRRHFDPDLVRRQAADGVGW